MHTKYLNSWKADNEDYSPKYSEWDIRTAWDNTIADCTTEGSPSFAFDSYAFKAFLKGLEDTIKEKKVVISNENSIDYVKHSDYEKLQQENLKLKQACEVMREALINIRIDTDYIQTDRFFLQKTSIEALEKVKEILK